MAKFVFVLLIVCFLGAFASASDGYSDYSIDFSTSFVKDESTELYVTIASGIFDFVAKFIRAKVEIILFFKKLIVQVLVRGLASLRFSLVHNANFVHGIITTVAELVKMLLTNTPHYAVPQIQKIITQAEREYIPYY